MIFCNRILAIIIFLLLLVLLVVTAAYGEDGEPPLPSPEHQQYMLSWIPAACCVTSGTCCREISSKDVTSLPDNNFLIKESGQVKQRTGPSPDGKYYRCSCEYAGDNKWRWTPKGLSRCLFTPEMSF
jgi:hypothetical protein